MANLVVRPPLLRWPVAPQAAVPLESALPLPPPALPRTGTQATPRRIRSDGWNAFRVWLILIPWIGLGVLWPGAAPAQSILIERVVEKPSGEAGAPALLEGNRPWYDAPLQVEGAAKLRVLSPDAEVAGAFRFEPMPNQPGTLELRVILYARPDPLEYRLLGQSQVLREGKLVPAREHFPIRGLDTELSGETGRVARIVVQDDHGSELRWRQMGDLLVLEAIPPEFGGKPVGAAEPWWAERRLRFLDYDLLAGGFKGANALGEWELLDLLALKFNGFFGSRDSLLLERIVLRNQVWRSETFSAWLEGGAAFVQRLDTGNSVTDSDVTWVLGGTGHWRSGDWGAALHVATVDGPLVAELYGGWQFSRRWGLFVAWQQFKSESAYALGLAVDF